MKLIREDLQAGEETLWEGAPLKCLRLDRHEWLFIPFAVATGLPITLAGSFVFYASLSPQWNIPFQFVFLGLTMILIGAHLLVGRFWTDIERRKRTRYAITTRRVIESSGLLRPRLRETPIEQIKHVSVKENKDGTGTITFGEMHAGSGIVARGVSKLELVQNPREVRDIIFRLAECQR
jgi:hypothetical protein